MPQAKKTQNPSRADLERAALAALNEDIPTLEEILGKYGIELVHAKMSMHKILKREEEREREEAAAAEAPGGKTYIVKQLGSRFGGNCVACGQPTGKRPFELEQTILLQEPEDKKEIARAKREGRPPPPKPPHAVAHPRCVGISTKYGARGIKVRGTLPDKVVVPPR